MNPRVVIAVTMDLLLQERAAQEQREYIGDSRYSKLVPTCHSAYRLQKFGEAFRRGQKVRKDRDIYDLFCKVCQSYRLKGWEFTSQFFEEE